MDEIGVSVVVPTYNRADYIGATLDAILSQDSQPCQVIVVDDGSTDATLDLLRAAYAGVKVVSVPNGGDLVARNVGLRSATGRLVAFCDSDDLWRPGYLTAMTALWRDAPALMTAYGNFHIVRDGVWQHADKFDDAPAGFWEGARPAGPDAILFEQSIIARLLEFQPFFPSAMVVDRARFLAVGGWDETVSRIVGTDFATALRTAEQPIGVVTRALVGIRRHGGNFSADVQAMNLGDASILEQILGSRPALAPHRQAVLASIAARRAAAADTAFDRDDFAAVRRIQAMLPAGHRSLRQRIKRWISLCPGPLARTASAAMRRLASVR